MPVTAVRVERVTADNVAEACRLAVRPGQERYVAPVAVSLARSLLPGDPPPA